jgi:gentisate 1,2-dioxygenase
MREGRTVKYEDYRSHFDQIQELGAHWSWSSLLTELEAARHGERGSLTLSSSGDTSGCELIPGLSINVQVVPAASVTRSHAHAWWHIFLVQEGRATAILGETRRELAPSDLLLVPAWVTHRFENSNGYRLILLSFSNLPQQRSLSNLRASEPPTRNEGVTNSFCEGVPHG